jgi:hypothetical protein
MTPVVVAILAIVCGAAGAFALYLCSPNQRLLTQPLAPRAGVRASVVGLLASLLLFLQVAGPATSVFLLLTLAMFVWTIPPLVIGWRRSPGSARS